MRKPAEKRPQGAGALWRLFVVGAMIVPLVVGGCSHVDEGALTQEANQFFNQGNYEAALAKYEQVIGHEPSAADRILFEMGITYAYPTNARKDYLKALECFQKVIRDYPESDYRHDSQMMILQIQNVIVKDSIIEAQQAQIEASQHEARSRADEVAGLQAKIALLEEKVFALRTAPADRVLIEKRARRLTLFAEGEVIRTYRIALGGDPVGPKEKQGDNKTPEGTYIIDSRNGNSGYYLSLHISYPNEKDRMRARELGVSPGGDIMIHGIKNGFAQVGPAHAERDWTEGCIAVTNREMEEIYKFVPNGTPVEITP
jgi:lipoprotein-anchoring transpeptidase ErfK/SrfK